MNTETKGRHQGIGTGPRAYAVDANFLRLEHEARISGLHKLNRHQVRLLARKHAAIGALLAAIGQHMPEERSTVAECLPGGELLSLAKVHGVISG